MDNSAPYNSSTSQYTFNPRHETHLTNDRQQISELSSRPMSDHHSQSRQSYLVRQNMDSMPSEPNKPSMIHRPTSLSPNTPLHRHETLTSSLHFDYHTRYPSPPPTEAGFSAIPPPFAYPSPSSVQRSVRDRLPNHQRTGSSPPRHPSPNTLRRTNNGSSPASHSPVITLPPLSTIHHRPPAHRPVDQPPNHQHHPEIPAAPRKSSIITQPPRDNHGQQQGPLRRHTVDSAHGQMVPGVRKRTLSSLPSPSYPVQLHRSPIEPGMQQVPIPPQSSQTKLTSNPHSTPSPFPTPRRDKPPALDIPPASPSPSTSQPQQLAQSPRSFSQPTPTDEFLPEISVAETADTALEPLRLGFENVWAETVQNVRQVMGKVQKDLTRMINTERRKNVNLMRCLVSSGEKLKGQEWAVEELKKENGALMQKALENEQLRREKIDENRELRRENEELKKKNEETKEALAKATGFIFEYKEELAKAKADVDTFRKCISANDSNREIARLHAEKEKERIFNDAVKQLRALTALEDTEREAAVVRTALKLSNTVDDDQDRRIAFRKNPSPPSAVPRAHYAQPEILPTNEPDNREIVDVEMGDDDNSVKYATAPNPLVEPGGAEHDVVKTLEQQPTDESRNLEEESDLEIQRQRQRRARRGPTPSSSPLSSPQAGSRKPSPGASKTMTGMKRNREEYEDGQVDDHDHDHDVRIVVEGERKGKDPIHGSISAETEAVRTNADNSEPGEVVLERDQTTLDVEPKSRTAQHNNKVSTDEKQVTTLPQTEIQAPMVITPLSNKPIREVHPKALGRWTYYTHVKDSGPTVPTRSSFTTAQQQQSTTTTTTTTTSQPLSTTQAQRFPKKLGINHMDLLYKTEKDVMVCRICLSLEQNSDTTTAERRKAKANTKKFPLNASWTDLISHCQTEHTKACEDMEKLSPSQLAEMKQRMPQSASMR